MKDNLHVVIIVLLLFSPVFYDLFRLIKMIRLNQISSKKLKSYIKRIIYFLVGSLAIILSLNHTNYLNYESPIPYNEIDRITLKNFRGLEFFRISFKGNHKYAYIVTTIDTEISKDWVRIESFFHPSRSYVYNKKSYSKELLTHEIYHFKITELFARRMKKDISNLDSYDSDLIKSIIEENRIKENEYQRAYDSDTYHSYILKEQKRYEREIDSLIYSLHDFGNSIIEFDEK